MDGKSEKMNAGLIRYVAPQIQILVSNIHSKYHCVVFPINYGKPSNNRVYDIQ